MRVYRHGRKQDWIHIVWLTGLLTSQAILSTSKSLHTPRKVPRPRSFGPQVRDDITFKGSPNREIHKQKM